MYKLETLAQSTATLNVSYYNKVQQSNPSIMVPLSSASVAWLTHVDLAALAPCPSLPHSQCPALPAVAEAAG